MAREVRGDKAVSPLEDHAMLVVVRGDGTILVEGKEGSPAMAESLLRRILEGDDLVRALAALHNLTRAH